MRTVWAAILLLLVTAPPLLAGGWLREPGSRFVAISGTLRSSGGKSLPTSETSQYTEIGLAPRLTMGLDINERPNVAGHLLVFARVPLIPTTGPKRLALELGVGAHHYGPDWNPMFKGALAYGQGFSGVGGGWLGIEAAIEHRQGSPDLLFKLDAALGLPSQSQFRPMVQFESAYTKTGGLNWALTPSLIISGKTERKWVVGLEARSAKTRTIGLKIAMWNVF